MSNRIQPIEKVNIENFKSLQTTHLELKNQMRCPNCQKETKSLICIDMRFDSITMELTTRWRCFNGFCNYQVDYFKFLRKSK